MTPPRRVRVAANNLADGFVCLWRSLAPVQRRLLVTAWICLGAGAVLSSVSPGLRVVLSLAVLSCMCYTLKIAKDVREELEEARRLRDAADSSSEDGQDG